MKALDLSSFKKLKILTDEPMKEHISFKLGGKASRFIIADESEAPALIAELNRAGERYAVLGNGSNVLVRDHGFDGTIVKLAVSEPVINGEELTVGAGTSLALTASAAAEQGLTGLEFAHGIPGSVGGAVMMNAGAYGGEIKDVLVSTVYCDPQGNVHTLSLEEHNFGYRQSFFKDHPELLILKSVFRLSEGDKAEIKEKMADLARRRRESQPLDKPSAGSTFKRPEGHFAGKLIQDSNLKGFTIGGAQVSEKHAGFVINTGNATCADVLALVEHIKDTVYGNFGVELHREVKILGEE